MPTVEQYHADMQRLSVTRQLRRHAEQQTRINQQVATVTQLRPMVFTGTAGI